MLDSVQEQLASLPELDKSARNDLWKQLFKKPPPRHLRPRLMKAILAHRLQEDAVRPLSSDARRQLRQLAATFEADPKASVSNRPSIRPGTRLVREWQDHICIKRSRSVACC
jgi:hypothetical protein